MLVLTRKTSETIHIGEDIVIKVLQTGRGAIKIGIEAPADVRVLRGEVAEAAAKLVTGESALPSLMADRPRSPRSGRTEPFRTGAV